MKTAKPFIVVFLILCCIYRSEGQEDEFSTLLEAVKQLNSTLQQTASELHDAKNVITTMNSTIQQSEMKISALEQEVHRLGQGTTPPVVFYAYLTRDRKLGPDQAVRFDHVLTNVGNAYDPRHGHFTAPVDGYYHFSATVLSLPGEDLHISMVKNGVEIAKFYSGNTDWQTGSGSVDIELAADDHVWLMDKDTSLHTIRGFTNSLFSGFIINKKV